MKVKKRLNDNDLNDLDQELHEELKTQHLGGFLKKLNIECQDLLTKGSLAKLAACPPVLCVNGLIIELMIFQHTENVTDSQLRREWWEYVGLGVKNLTECWIWC